MIVLDAGAAVAMEAGALGGDEVAKIVLGNRIIVPDLFFIETTSVLRKMAIARHVTWAQARDAAMHLYRMRCDVVPHRSLFDDQWNQTIRKVDAYDGAYAAIARGLNIPVVTLDSKRTFEEAGVQRVIHVTS